MKLDECTLDEFERRFRGLRRDLLKDERCVDCVISSVFELIRGMREEEA